ncbi:hypothetical protein [Streptomyces sp. NBC_00059]|uniref:hypothetical protein n=1 Tax=Streptomyces sp. NBC_00059 TaxID=2975635 RepID=UPI0022580448|nr:hypothetical protein [Streptomyces sp. NBC_00059]MCX5413556.1 hypothetical protein [Streptomyces sp. NBC_00059]
MAVACAVLSLAFAVSGCTSGDTAEPQSKDELCRLGQDSAESTSLRRLVGENDISTEISNDDDDLVESMEDWLKPGGAEMSALPLRMCSYRPEAATGAHMVSLEFGWLPLDEAAGKAARLPGKVRHYDLDGATAQANDINAKLTVPCRMPGDLGDPSAKVLLEGKVSNTLLVGTDVEQKTVDQQVTFLYLMTRRATEALGCENDPLTEDPVVQASPTPAA